MAFDVNLYFSGSVDQGIYRDMISRDVHRLVTFAYPKEADEYLCLADEMGVRCRMMIDSGAFTSWSIGKPVQLADLIAFNKRLLRDYGDRHDFVFISLDVIPGSKETRPTVADFTRALEQSYDNFKVLQQEFPGYEVLPVYHSGEDVALRNAYLELTDYICLSMDQTMSERNRLEWARRSAVPGYRYHGLAATGNKMVTEIDWFSVDSSSWVTVGSMGNILWPLNGRFGVLAVSKDSPNRHTAGKHVDTLVGHERQYVERLVQAQGFTMQELADEYKKRHLWNVRMWCNPPWKTNVVKPVDLFS